MTIALVFTLPDVRGVHAPLASASRCGMHRSVVCRDGGRESGEVLGVHPDRRQSEESECQDPSPFALCLLVFVMVSNLFVGNISHTLHSTCHTHSVLDNHQEAPSQSEPAVISIVVVMAQSVIVLFVVGVCSCLSLPPLPQPAATSTIR